MDAAGHPRGLCGRALPHPASPPSRSLRIPRISHCAASPSQRTPMNCWKASLLARPQHSPVAPTTTQPQPWRRDWKSRPLRLAAWAAQAPPGAQPQPAEPAGRHRDGVVVDPVKAQAGGAQSHEEYDIKIVPEKVAALHRVSSRFANGLKRQYGQAAALSPGPGPPGRSARGTRLPHERSKSRRLPAIPATP